MGTTVFDNVKAFTFTVDIEKVDRDGKVFDGAGLGIGDCKLVEVRLWTGITQWADLEFSIVADNIEDGDGNSYVTGFKAVVQGRHTGKRYAGRIDIRQGYRHSFTNIANYKGSELPCL